MKSVRTKIFSGLLLAALLLAARLSVGAEFRPPAAPLVTVDPYTSCWSMGDTLYGDWPKHWTGKDHHMCGMIRVDGKPMRFMGGGEAPGPVRQTSLKVNATQTIYTFVCGGVDLKVTFTSPLLMDDLEVLSRPASYITFAATANDGRAHRVELYFDASALWAVNGPRQPVQWSRFQAGNLLSGGALDVMKLGSMEQKTLAVQGDDVRIDWGHLLIAVPHGKRTKTVMTEAGQTRGGFVNTGLLPSKDDQAMPRSADERWPVLAATLDLGQVSARPVSRHLIVAYDDIYSIEYNHRKLRALWRSKEVADPEKKILAAAERDYSRLMKRCEKFDRQLAESARKSGGEEYAAICALVYRQAIAAHKLVVDTDGTKFFFSKECFSNGSINTVDVTYPSTPMFLIYNPELVKGMMEPIFQARESGRWTKPFAPHDSGSYPIANGQGYGGDMPVEESGNMVILAYAIAIVEGNANYAQKHWAVLTEWTQYLKKEGFNPANQLCTDDFAGHLAHNANLSIKAILALGCYGKLAGMLGDQATETDYTVLARDLAQKWIKAAGEEDHYRLAFDQKGTWSQKYNLVWDRVLGLDVFPPEVARKEIAWYLKHLNKYGLPLDSRQTYTKSDWICWTATMTESPEDFQKLIHPIYLYLNESPSRVPASDFHWTLDGKVTAFQARSVVGGYYMKMLYDKIERERAKK